MNGAGPRILFAGDADHYSLTGVRALRRAGLQSLLATPRTTIDVDYAARSRAVEEVICTTPPATDIERYATEIADAAKRFHVSAVLPATEASLRALTGQEGLFPSEITVATPDRAALDRATDKQAIAQLATDAGLDSLPTIEIAKGSVPPREELPMPCVVKPIRSVELGPASELRLSAAHVVRTASDFDRALAATPGDRVLVQPYCPGGLGAVCCVAWEGEVVCAFHQRARRIWPPEGGVSSFAVGVAPDHDREERVAALIRAIGWSGVFAVQFLFVDDRAYVIDVNPRLYGSLALAVASGLNLPAIWANLVLGRSPQIDTAYRVGVGYRVEEDDYRALWVAFRNGSRAAALRGLLPRRHTVHAVFSWTDPAPSWVSVRKLIRSFRGGED